jgi:hypothetical protein
MLGTIREIVVDHGSDAARLKKEGKMRGKISSGCLQLAWFALVSGAACQPPDRPPLDRAARDAAEQAAANNQDAGPLTQGPAAPEPSPAAGGSSGGESLPPIVSVEPGAAVGDQSSTACEGDAGTCLPVGDAGPLPTVCVATGARDCTSELDNDCDGQPDNVLDAVCVCAPGSVEPCDEHPGLDGRGQCVAGSRTCIASEGNVSSGWGACEGAVGPREADACTPGDDGDCNGIPNEECPCVDGDTQECGPSSNDGICQRGVSTCVNAAFGECVGAIFGGARDCSSAQDNDCDGRPDNAIDNTCTCAIGAVQACGAHPGDGNGQCRAGSQTCVGRANNSTSGFGACTGSVGPQPQDSCVEGNDGDCDGVENEGCGCFNGATRQCGSTSTGACSFGTETCTNGRFGNCQGAVNPAPSDSCSVEGDDSNCNGIANEGCALLLLGEPCERDQQCAVAAAGVPSVCESFYVDEDGDGFSPTLDGEQRLCSNTFFVAEGRTKREPVNAANRDCSDDDDRVRPGQQEYFSTAIPGRSPLSAEAYDYNCDGENEYIYQADTERSVADGPTCFFAPFDLCDGGLIWAEIPQCGFPSNLATCGERQPQDSFPGIGCASSINNVAEVVPCR